MKSPLILLMIISINFVNAQFIKQKAINAQVGLAFTYPYESYTSFAGTGFNAQAELVLKAASWVDFRPFAGIILTQSDGEDYNGHLTFESVETKAFLLGGTARLRAPIPYIAPYVEIGVGVSIGKFKTIAGFDNYNGRGIIPNFPISIGVELGRDHGVDLGFQFYQHPTVGQYTGIMALGITIPLKNKKV